MNRKLKEHGTELREKIYRFIVDYIMKNGFAHTIREIVQAVKISVGRVAQHLMKLEIEGRIKVKPNSPRAIKVIGYKYVKEVKQ